ncbi:MAG: 16S rRNA (guanine(966)-N(2))-methyltransferase RsmD [Verrucomicrobiae bacterium]|nr:16S rRNA (guanine(966)-N(2))-methyltransferase RsmD [Verrucomicrobiae bacterium]
MRIISGAAGGIPIACPKSVTRPTSDRVREALFSIVGNLVSGARVLDLYAGSGALGLEALSRGAASVVFVEHQKDACRVIESNIAKTRLEGATVVSATVESWLNRRNSTGTFELILADPPYCKSADDTDFAAELLSSAPLPRLLSPTGLMMMETQSNQALPDAPHFEMLDRRVYGSTAVQFFCCR